MAPYPPSNPTSWPAATCHHPRNFRRGTEERNINQKPRPERSASFHGKTTAAAVEPRPIPRPKTHPDLLNGRSPLLTASKMTHGEKKTPTKILLNVTVQRSLGALQVMASAEWTVGELVVSAVGQYIKERRRPLLPSSDTSTFSLHYSQFSLESLNTEVKLIELGSRNFFLCSKTTAMAPNSCSNEVQKESKLLIPFLNFMDFLL